MSRCPIFPTNFDIGIVVIWSTLYPITNRIGHHANSESRAHYNLYILKVRRNFRQRFGVGRGKYREKCADRSLAGVKTGEMLWLNALEID